MFIVVKNGFFSNEYFRVNNGQNSTSYAMIKNEDEATKFSSESEAISHLKKSGFNGFGGLEVVEI